MPFETMRASSSRSLGVRNLVRLVFLATTLLFYITAILEYPEPAVMAVGLVPIVWISLEGIWRVFEDKR